MKTKRTMAAALILAVVLMSHDRLSGDDANCVIVSAGAQMEGTPNALYNAGQVAIGTTSGGGVIMHVGGIHCLAEGVAQCLKGDVDTNGLINGGDIDEYVIVTLTGVGTAKQLCAADLEVAEFVALLLN